MNILMSKKPQLRPNKIALEQTLTLNLGVTLVLTVTQVYIFAEQPVCHLKNHPCCLSRW